MRATVRLELRRTDDDTLVDVRHAKNSVMRGGAELVANLFAGKPGAGITHMGVGISAEAENDDFVRTGLTTAGDAPDTLTGDTEAVIAPADVTIHTDAERRMVIVQINATLPKAAAIGTLREAGLVAHPADVPAVLYNRVTFAPIRKSGDHELTMFWEVTFPYGDLNWM